MGGFPIAFVRETGGSVALTGRTGRWIRDDGTPVFTKARADAPAHLFEREAAGLRALAAAGARVPRVLGWSETGLEIEWIDDGGRRTRQTEAAFGRELAGFHAGSRPEAGAPDRFGSPDDVAAGWLGACPVDYTPAYTWAESWVGRRILPLARRAERAGVVPASARADAERLAELTDGFGPDAPAHPPGAAVLGPAEPSSLVHGDLWAGNRLVDADGRPWLIDPSAHRGHREADLAMMRLFGGFGEEAFAAYREAFPLADRWRERVLPYQAVPLLVHAVLFGGGYGEQAAASLRAAVRLAS